MVCVGAKDIKWGTAREEKILGILNLFCSGKLEKFQRSFFSGNWFQVRSKLKFQFVSKQKTSKELFVVLNWESNE
jgi:hypothetical protein